MNDQLIIVEGKHATPQNEIHKMSSFCFYLKYFHSTVCNIEKCVSNVDVHFGMKIEFRLKWIYTIIKIDLTNMI